MPEVTEQSSNSTTVHSTVRFQIDEIDSSFFNTNSTEEPLPGQSQHHISSILSIGDSSSAAQPIIPNLAPSVKPRKKQQPSNSVPSKAPAAVIESKPKPISKKASAASKNEQSKEVAQSEPRKRRRKDLQPEETSEEDLNEDEYVPPSKKKKPLPPKKKRQTTKKSSSASEKSSRFSIFPTSFGDIHDFTKHSLYVKVVPTGSGIEGITLENMENRAVVSAVSEQYAGSSSVQINDVVYAVNHLDARYSTFDQIMKALTRAPQTIEAYYDNMGYQRSALDIGSGGNRVALKHAVVDSIAMVVFARAFTVIVD